LCGRLAAQPSSGVLLGVVLLLLSHPQAPRKCRAPNEAAVAALSFNPTIQAHGLRAPAGGYAASGGVVQLGGAASPGHPNAALFQQNHKGGLLGQASSPRPIFRAIHAPPFLGAAGRNAAPAAGTTSAGTETAMVTAPTLIPGETAQTLTMPSQGMLGTGVGLPPRVKSFPGLMSN